MKLLPIAILLLVSIALTGCGTSGHGDLNRYIKKTITKPAGEIEPLPTFRPYKPYKYSSLALRSPFDRPKTIEQKDTSGLPALEPDLTRPKEFLEGINFARISMVGMMQKDNFVWGLVKAGRSGIHRVQLGNYLGKNHGKIVGLSTNRLDIVEIIPDGRNGWVERPRSLRLKEKKR